MTRFPLLARPLISTLSLSRNNPHLANRAFLLRSTHSATTLGASGSKVDPMSVQASVENTISENTVTVFSKSWCPYCASAKKLIKSLDGVDAQKIKIIELDEDDRGSAMQAYLQTKTGQRTVPNIFINQEHIGGNDDIQALHRKGKLLPLVNGKQ